LTKRLAAKDLNGWFRMYGLFEVQTNKYVLDDHPAFLLP
jgi:hypothetical protein